MERTLPNQVKFGTTVVPDVNAVRMEMWLTNGTDQTLTGLRVQNCVMLKEAKGFEGLTVDNKVLEHPFVACRNEAGDRWIITAWEHCTRPWANSPCPCMHSDPQFPDFDPGETQRLKGWFWFYDGTDIEAQLERLRKQHALDG